MIINIGEIARVSDKSRSKAAGRLVEVVGLRTNGTGRVKEVKVRIIPSSGKIETQYAYVSPKFLETRVSAHFASVKEVESTKSNAQFKWPLCKGVEFVTAEKFDYIDDFAGPSKTDRMCGFITDQWIEDGKKLYNIVFLGDFRVVEESEITRYASPRKA